MSVRAPQLCLQITDRNGRVLASYAASGSRQELRAWRAGIYEWLAEKWPASHFYWFGNWS